MAGVSLRDFLGYVSLTSMVNTNVEGLPRRLPKFFYDVTPEKVEGNAFRFTQFTHARTMATLSEYYAPTRPVQLRPIGQRDMMLFSSGENIKFDAWVLEALRDFENYQLQEKGKQLVAKNVREFALRFDHLEDILSLLILCNGVVYRDNAGNVLPTSSGATITADMLVPAGNKGTVAAVSGVAGAWNSPTTNIWLQLTTMQIIAQAAHGYTPKIILYGKNIPTYIANNDHMIPYLSRTPNFRDGYVSKGYIEPTYDLAGYTWYPISDAGFNDQNGVYRRPISDDAVIMLPEPSDMWWGRAEGSYMIPTTLNIMNGADVSVESLQKLYGRWSYSKLVDDPTSMAGYAGWNGMSYLKIPETVYQLTAI